MKFKITFFLYSLSGGGAERTVLNIINNLNKDKYEVTLVLGTDKNNDYSNYLDENIRVVNLKCTKLRYCIFKLRKYLLKEKPDLVFSTINPNNIIVLLTKLLTFKNIPIIVREANHRTQSGSVTKINKALTNLLYNYVSNKVIALSKGVKKDLVNNFNVNEDKIKVIYNPIEVDKIVQNSNDNINSFERNQNEKLIISVGRLIEQKGFDTLIEAFFIISQQINARLIILGKGEDEEKLKALSEKLGISDKIHFLGFVSNPYKYIKRSDIFILSSKWEGFGHVIVEAMASGTPVIATDCNSGPAEIIEDQTNGYLVPVDDYHKLAEVSLKLLNSDKKMNSFKNAGYQRSLDFKADKIVLEYEVIFNNILNKTLK